MNSVIKKGWLFVAGMFLPWGSIFAAEAGEAAAHGASNYTWLGPAAGLAMGLAVLGGATAQGKIAAAFMEGTARNPGAKDVMFVPLILSLVFVETLVLFTLVIAYMLQAKI